MKKKTTKKTHAKKKKVSKKTHAKKHKVKKIKKRKTKKTPSKEKKASPRKHTTVKKTKVAVKKQLPVEQSKGEKETITSITLGTKKTTNKKLKNKRISTGIKNLDKLMQGGLESYSTNTIVGGAGSGKSILATQFLIEGLKKGETCLYVTFEEKKKRFYRNMTKLGWDLEEYEKKGLFTFLEYTPIKVKTMLEEGGGAIETLVLTKKISRMVIDSLTSFALLFEDELTKREAGLSLFNMIRKWSCTSFLTLEEEPTPDKKTSSKPLEFESDSIILLYFIRKKGQRKRYIEILKMRGTKHSKSIHPFIIENKGIKVSKAAEKNLSKM